MLLWIAQGFGVGRIPFAPGTFGSMVGVLWFLLLLIPGSVAVFTIGSIAGVAASVWLCGAGEKILSRRDPGSIVVDEITAMPLCFVAWLAFLTAEQGALPRPDYFLSNEAWIWTAGVFVAFRFFDVVKPWPVQQSQSLPGGWGVTVDDVLAAVYVNLVFAAAFALHARWTA
jgi:phosphatidylglycerophosphatase A